MEIWQKFNEVHLAESISRVFRSSVRRSDVGVFLFVPLVAGKLRQAFPLAHESHLKGNCHITDPVTSPGNRWRKQYIFWSTFYLSLFCLTSVRDIQEVMKNKGPESWSGWPTTWIILNQNARSNAWVSSHSVAQFLVGLFCGNAAVSIGSWIFTL